VLAACSSEAPPPAAACPMPPSRACPSPPAAPPSYKTDVRPILEAYCAPCHFPGGTAVASSPSNDYTTYATGRGKYSAFPGVLLQCLMPLNDAGALPLADKQTLVEWASCGSPNN
jgi:hypothetical protein